MIANEMAPSRTAVGLVAVGIGVSLVWDSMRLLQRPGMVYRPLVEPVPRIGTALAWRRDNPSKVVRALVGVAREVAVTSSERRAHSPVA
jgi:DNA-binding transcriptional LysR family regulator